MLPTSCPEAPTLIPKLYNVLMAAQPNPSLPWKVTATIGITLIIIAVVTGYIDVATHFRFGFLSDHSDTLLLAGLLGVVMSSVGLVGWAG
jgi:hypothetical protein